MSHACAPTASPSDPIPVIDVLNATVGDMKQGKWEAAANGLLQLHAQLGERMPRPMLAKLAACLHRLGRYADAERVAHEGLGAQRDLIALRGTPPPEETLTRGWRRDAAPLVSIVCITYNHERYLDDTLRGFFLQRTNFPFEVLIHDDASTDGTAALIRSWQARYPSIIRAVLQTENQMSRGVCPLNVLLPMARGKYVATCEGDDYWLEPTKLQRQVSFLEQHPDFSCSAHNYYLYSEIDLSVRAWSESRSDVALAGRHLMSVKRLLWLPTLVFRKTFSQLPPERSLSPIADQLITSYLGTFGQCAYFESVLGAVRRANPFSIWMPLPEAQKEAIRVKNWLALIRLHERLGHPEVVADFQKRIHASRLDDAQKTRLRQQFQESPDLSPAPVS